MIVVFRDPADRAYSVFKYFRKICSNYDLELAPYNNNSFYNATISGLKLLDHDTCSFNTGI